MAKYEVTAKVFVVNNIGQLVDELLRAEVYKINSFEWKSAEVDTRIYLGKKRRGSGN